MIENVFDGMSNSDIERVGKYVEDMGIMSTVWNPSLILYIELIMAAAITEIRDIELGTQTLTVEQKKLLDLI